MMLLGPASCPPALNLTTSAIAIRDLCFSYPDKLAVLEDVNLQVMPGNRVGIIGPNGAGKTTLFLAICNLLKPTSGRIWLLGEPTGSNNLPQEVGLVFQNPNDQLFSASVWDDVAFGPENLGLSPAEVHQRAAIALALTGTTTLAHRSPHHLSGGEKRMVAIAGILAMKPQIIIYDEPSANLDLRARRRLIQFLEHSQETLLIASHDLELILEVCDRVILLDEGKIVADGKPPEIMGNEALMLNHGLETPHSLLDR